MAYLSEVTTTTQIALGYSRRFSLKVAKLGIVRELSKMPRAIAHAFEMAYFTPFNASQSQSSTAVNEDLEGRDPNW